MDADGEGAGELERVRAVARSYFEGESDGDGGDDEDDTDDDEGVPPAHDWHHVERVEALANRLAAGRSDVDQRVLRLAVLLHDIGRKREDDGRIEDHAEWGAREARGLLGGDSDEHDHDHGLGVAVEPDTIDAVAHCIRAHRYSNDVEPETPEARILSDADNLDALGAIGIARVFAYGGENGVTIHDPAVPIDADDSRAGETSVNHIYKKILDLPNRMYTDEGRALAAERAAFVEEFVARLEAEVVGDR